MSNIKDVISFRYKKISYKFPFSISKGVINLDFGDGDDVLEEVKNLAYEKVSKKFLNPIDNEPKTKTENESKKINDTTEKDTLNDYQSKILEMQKTIEQLELKLASSRRGGRPSIGITRKRSINLPRDAWSRIDDLVEMLKDKGETESSILRMLILNGLRSWDRA